MTENNRHTMKRRRNLLKPILLTILGIWAAALILLQIMLTPTVLTGITNRIVPQFVDGEISFGKVKASVFRNFPNLNVSFDRFAVTYPSERFEPYGAGRDWHTRQGRGEGQDTLMSFNHFSASVNIASLISNHINIKKIQLSNPRIFATLYNDSTATWNVFRIPEQEEDSTEAAIPKITIGEVSLTEHPKIIFNSIPDSVRMSLTVGKMELVGKVSSDGIIRKDIGMSIDSLFVAGQFPTDTAAFKLDRFEIRGNNGGIDAKAVATAFVGSGDLGRMKLPVEMSSRISFPDNDLKRISVESFKADLASIPLSAEADINFHGDSIYVRGEASIDGCKVSEPLNYFGKNFWKGARDLRTDAVISMTAIFDGWFDQDGHIPALLAELKIPKARVQHKGLKMDNAIGLALEMQGTGEGKIDIVLNEASIDGKALFAMMEGSVTDLTGKDPEFTLDGGIILELDSLSNFIQKKSGWALEGRMATELKGKIRKSQLSPYRFADADLEGYVSSERLRIGSDKDTVGIHVDSLDIRMSTYGNKDKTNIREGERMMSLLAEADTLGLTWHDLVYFNGHDLSLSAENAAAILNQEDSSAFYPFDGLLKAGKLEVKDSKDAVVAALGSETLFTIAPKEGSPETPVLTFFSQSKHLYARDSINRMGIQDLNLFANAAMNTVERQKKIKVIVDSLSRCYPDVPRDSMFNFMVRKRKSELPEWMKEEDFKKQDLNFSLDENLRKYFINWDLEGSVSIGATSVMTPYFPVSNKISHFSGSFNNDEIGIESVKLEAGSSNLEARGKLSGLKSALLMNGIIRLDLAAHSDSLDVNQLLTALSNGSSFAPSRQEIEALSEMEDQRFEQVVQSDTTRSEDAEPLLVIPANVDATISLEAENVRYSKLQLAWMASDLKIKERCIQLTNTVAMSNVGDVYFEGFYSTRTKKDIRTGFDINFANITTEKVIEMIPAVDTIMPLLKSFKGNLDCEMAATAALDEKMNVVTPSINGIIRVGGKHLQLENDKSLKKIAKILKFKDREISYIDEMTAESMISDNKLEIFPFVLNIDRYVLAMSGVQNLDTSFKYHISVIDSPLPFRLGIDLKGNFEDFKYKIGRAKYKNTNVPVFTAAVDQVKFNLGESIRNIFQKGVDKAISENEKNKEINGFKSEIGYVEAVEEQLDSLTAEEKDSLELE